jgi:arylsulfatase A-like enzyme
MRPNILLIYTDQQRYDSLGCYGNHLVYTPNLNRLASEGALFENYFVQSPVCMASRMSFLTGRYCSNLGIGANGVPLPESVPNIAHLLKPYGYHTAQIGKLHFQPHAKRNHKNPHPLYGFDTMILSDEPGCYEDAYIKWVENKGSDIVDKARTSLPDAALMYAKGSKVDVPRNTHEPFVFEGDESVTHSAFVASETIDYIKRRKNDPFFCISGFYAPHTPVNPPKKWVDYYDKVTFEPPHLGKNEEYMDFLKEIDEIQWQKIKRYYMALVSHVDECVGKILNTLEEEGLKDNTIVLFTSDHGEFLGDHGRIQKGRPGHDCIIKVPLLLRYPKHIAKGLRLEALTEGVDMLPTILDFCGIQSPDFLQGKSWLPILQQRTTEHKDEIIMEYFDPCYNDRPLLCHTTIRTKQYKYYLSDVEEGLYDMQKDPYELDNVINQAQYSEIISQLRRSMVRKLQQIKYYDNNWDAPY